MPLPLVWLGAGVAVAAASAIVSREKQKLDGHIVHFPGESDDRVAPIDGSIMCCGVYEMLQHTGIWVEDTIIELNGNGLIRGVSPHRFLADRSGDRIYIACDEHARPLTNGAVSQRALSRLYSYEDYHVLANNCHRFVRYCVTGSNERLTRFAELNEALCVAYETPVYWHKALI